MGLICSLSYQPTHFDQHDLYWFWVEVLWAARTSEEGYPDKPFARRSCLMPCNRQAKWFCCSPMSVPSPVVLLRDLRSWGGEWWSLLSVGWVGHTIAALAKLGILELLLQSRGLLSVGIWLLGRMGDRHPPLPYSWLYWGIDCLRL